MSVVEEFGVEREAEEALLEQVGEETVRELWQGEE
jgi:hypothetical protein